MLWTPPRIIDKRWILWRLSIHFSWRSAKGLMGRFGGGWNWKLGFQASSRTVLISLLIAELTLTLDPK